MLPDHQTSSGSGFRTLLKNRHFLLLWGGQILSQVADKVFFVLLIALLETYQSSLPQNSMRSVIMLALTLPAILFGSAAGIFVDRFPKKQIMVASDIIRALLILAIPILPKQFLILLIITFLISSITQVFAPAEQAAIPLLVKAENLMTANALFTTTMIISLIVGFAVGPPLLSLARILGGKNSQEIFIALLYLIAACLGQLVQIKEPAIVNESAAVNPLKDLKAGLNYLWNNPLIRNAMIQITILYSVLAALMVLAIPLAQEIGFNEPDQFSFLLAGCGVGLILGAGILGHWGERFHHKPLPLLGFMSMAFALLLFTFTESVPLGLGLSAILGWGASLIAVPMQTLIQQQTSESMRGKVFGFQNNVVNIALSLPLAIAGPLTDAVGLRPVLVTMSIIVSIVGVWAWQSTRRVLEDVI